MPSIITNTGFFLPNNKLLSQYDFPDTTGLYVWPVNGSSDSATIANSYGGLDLTRVGALGQSTNHLGQTVYNYFDTNDILYAAGTTFDTDNESFTTGGWFNCSTVSSRRDLIDKNGDNNTNISFEFYISNANLYFNVYYSGVTAITVSSVMNDVNGWHHLVAVYDATNRVMMLVVDGKVAAYTYNTNLATRVNNGNSKVQFGAWGNGYLGGSPFQGYMADLFYKKSAMTFDQIRKLYVAGTKRLAYLNDTKVVIEGESHFVHTFKSDTTIPSGTVYTSNILCTAYIPEDGEYKLEGYHTFSTSTVGGSASVTYWKFNNSYAQGPYTGFTSGMYPNTSLPWHRHDYWYKGWFKKNDKIETQHQVYTNTSQWTLQYGGNVQNPAPLIIMTGLSR